jgi:hypothetical protein
VRQALSTMLRIITIAKSFVCFFFFFWKVVSNTDFEGAVNGQISGG